MAFMFGGGPGWLPKLADLVAQKHGATLVNYTDAQCNCGSGHKPYTCPQSRRHWFAMDNQGYPFDQRRGAEVLKAVTEALHARA